MDRFEEMQAFVRVVDSGSFSAAAQRLNIAKSAISRRVAELEARLGVQLLTRTTRRLNLTEHGRVFHQRCVRILAELDDAEQSLSCENAALSGILRIAAPLSFGITHLAPVLNTFLLQHPALKLDLDLNDRTLNLMEESVDLGIRIGHLADSSLVARRLAPAKRMVCASPGYLEQYGEPLQPQDLSAHVGMSYSYMPENQLWQFRQADATWESITVPYRMRANNGDVLLQAAIDGLGILTSTSFICAEAIERGLLRPILSDYSMPEGGIYAVYPRQRHLPQRVRVLIDYLVTRFGDPPYWDLKLEQHIKASLKTPAESN